MTLLQRVRGNFNGGTLTDNPLATAAVTANSAEFVALPTITSGLQYLVLTLDPLGVHGDPEIVYVTVHAGGDDDAALVRGREGTTARDHPLTTDWEHAPTWQDFEPQWRDKITPPSFTVVRNTLDDEFNDDTLDGSWTRVDRAGNSAGLIYTEGSDVLSLLHDSGTDLGGEMHGLVKSLGGASFPLTLETAFRTIGPYATNYHMTGLVFADGTTYGAGKQMLTMPFIFSGAAGYQWSVRPYTNWLTETTNFDDHAVGIYNSPFFMRLKWSAANTFEAWYSCDGVSWIKRPNTTMSYTITPTHVGFVHSHWGTTKRTITSWEYFRVT